MTIDSHVTRAPLCNVLINIYNQNRGVGGGPFDKYAVSLIKTNFTYIKNFVLMALSLLNTYMLLESPHRRAGILAKGKFVYRLPRNIQRILKIR